LLALRNRPHAARRSRGFSHAGSVKLTINYKGKGTVDGSHQIWVWLFDNPNIGPGSMPIDQMSLAKNGGQVEFQGVAPSEVFIAVGVRREGRDGRRRAAADRHTDRYSCRATTVSRRASPGEKGIATVTFDDSLRMP
jgi:hypothetical protein